MKYYMLDSRNADNVMLLGYLQPVGGINWSSGQKFIVPVPEPLYVGIVEGYEVDTVPPAYTSRTPMMRDDLLQCIRDCGVTNIDSYPIIIRNKVTAVDITGYSGINILGLVCAADADKTVFSPDNPSRHIDADIDSLSIDPHLKTDLLIFRLAEAVTGVVVHEKIKNAIEAKGLWPELCFWKPEEWMG